MEQTTNIRDLFLLLRKRLWIVLLITLIATSASVAVSIWVMEPIYQANTTLYVGKKTNTEGVLSYQDVQMGGQLVKDYRELAKSRLVAGIVINELRLENTSTSQIADMLGVNLKNETRIIEITAQSTDPEFARNVANKVADVFKRKAIELIDVDNVQVIDIAQIPTSPIKPNKEMNIAIGFLLGLMLSLGLVFLLEFLDNTLKTPDDIEKHLGLPVIGTVPKFEDIK
jgi:capsular polysaccharide biosynthesis protein